MIGLAPSPLALTMKLKHTCITHQPNVGLHFKRDSELSYIHFGIRSIGNFFPINSEDKWSLKMKDLSYGDFNLLENFSSEGPSSAVIDTSVVNMEFP